MSLAVSPNIKRALIDAMRPTSAAHRDRRSSALIVALFGVEAFGNVSLEEFCKNRNLSESTTWKLMAELRKDYGIHRPQDSTTARNAASKIRAARRDEARRKRMKYVALMVLKRTSKPKDHAAAVNFISTLSNLSALKEAIS